MVVTLTPNAAIDITYTVEGFALDRVHRPSAQRTVAGGKGINVVRVLKTLGRDGIATGFVGGSTGDNILRRIKDERLPHDFVQVQDESRLCIAIVDPKTGTQTELNENGPSITPDELAAMMNKTRDLLQSAHYLALCGSCPPGVPESFYSDCIESANACGVKAILDTSGEHLRQAIKAGPYMVKPNLTELSQLAGREVISQEDALQIAKGIKHYGVSIIVVTMGANGAIVTDGEQSWLAVPPKIEFASAVGSGDSFLAAFLDCMMHDGALEESLAIGVAAGAANAATYGAGFCSKESIMELRQRVTLTRLD